jgi:pimeloyl-ACP methyl ester carboxylesterase
MFFGRSASPLFGIFEEPSDRSAKGHGVVLCPPVAQEHVRTHSLMKQVSAALVRAGYHTLRFDWFGVGDSAGSYEQATLARWNEDLAQASTELRDLSGIKKLSLFGVRVGATIALRAARQVKASHVLALDAVLDGAAYLRSQQAIHSETTADPKRYWQRPTTPHDAAHELVGFQVSDDFINQVRGLEPSSLLDLANVRVTLLESGSREAARSYSDRLTGAGVPNTLTQVAITSAWELASAVEERVLSANLPASVVSALSPQGAS